jgi:hypothetical protein
LQLSRCLETVFSHLNLSAPFAELWPYLIESSSTSGCNHHQPLPQNLGSCQAGVPIGFALDWIDLGQLQRLVSRNLYREVAQDGSHIKAPLRSLCCMSRIEAREFLTLACTAAIVLSTSQLLRMSCKYTGRTWLSLIDGQGWICFGVEPFRFLLSRCLLKNLALTATIARPIRPEAQRPGLWSLPLLLL